MVSGSMRMRPPTVEELESEWISGEDCTMADGLIPPFADAEAVWQAVLRIIQRELSARQISLLAAGPVEDLLALHGAQFIDRIEAEARRSPSFAHVLGGVRRRDIPQEIWERVEAARGGKVW
jgi:hypothetical protein